MKRQPRPRATAPHLLAAAALAACASVRAAEPLLITTEESVPFNMQANGQVVGVATDKVLEALHRARQPYRLELLPWPRAYQMALDRPQTCVYSTTRTPERESRFKWVGPLAHNVWQFYALTERKLQLHHLEQARGLRIGTYTGDVRDSFLRERGFTVEAVPNDEQNPRKLLLGRIDLWATGVKGRLLLQANGWTSQIVPVLTFNQVALYLACHPSVPDAVVTRLNNELQAMAADGTISRIEKQYEQWKPGAAPPSVPARVQP